MLHLIPILKSHIRGSIYFTKEVLFVVARHAVPNVGSRKGCPYILIFLGLSMLSPYIFYDSWAQRAVPLRISLGQIVICPYKFFIQRMFSSHNLSVYRFFASAFARG